jgi:hypothetical protein
LRFNAQRFEPPLGGFAARANGSGGTYVCNLVGVREESAPPGFMRYLLLSLTVYLLNVATAAEAQIGITAHGTTRKYATPPGGPASSYQKAIIIHSPDWSSGVNNEYSYMRSRFPGCKIVNHAREFCTRETYDIITFTTRDGTTGAVYFNHRQHS